MNRVQEEIQDIYNGLQTKLGNNDACHFLVLCTIIHEYRRVPVDILGLVSTCLHKGWIRNDFYVKDALAILQYCTGKRWSVRTETELPSYIADNEYTEIMWVRGSREHFTRRYVDTLRNSQTVKYGRIKEYRIYTVEE